ncbi:MAG: GGDEF domain-containing protein, partial [bacterium]|nr:GGDEF domain-containing protein [bacterium]
KIQKRVEDCRQMFQIPCHDLPSAGDLMALANEQLSELAFRAQVEREAAVQQQQVFEAQNRHLQEKQLQLVEESSRDPLTGAFNRRFFLDSLNREASRCQRDAASIGLLFIDVDHFKTFNDTYGHAAGDLVLKLVSDAITESLRGSDMACRYGGEEFVVLVNRPTRTTLELVGSRIREQIENAKLEFEGKQLHVTASLGASIGIPEQFATEFVDELIATADAAMYDAKKSGRNRLCLRTMLSSTK